MGFDPVHQHDAVGLRRIPVNIDRTAVAGIPDQGAVRACFDRTAAVFLPDAVTFQDRPLSLRRGSSVAAHGGYDKGPGSVLPQKTNGFPHDQRVVADSPASHRHGHRHTRPQIDQNFPPVETLPHLGRHIFQAGAVEFLADLHHIGNGYVFYNLIYNAHLSPLPFSCHRQMAWR